MAHGGSLFLDEVGEMPLSIQPRLFRAVEQGRSSRWAATVAVKVDVRLVSASNQDLLGLRAQERFRQDLYDRLAVLAIHLPPLRERPATTSCCWPAISSGKRASALAGGGPRVHPRGRGALAESSHWPGNVREFKNVVTRAVLFGAEGLIRDEDLAFTAYPSLSPGRQNPAMGEEMPASRPSPGRLKELLESEGGNVSAVSRRLQVCSKTVYRWARTYHIDLMGSREAEVV